MIINITDWSRPDGVPELNSLRRLLRYRLSIGAIVSWPVLLVANVCMT